MNKRRFSLSPRAALFVALLVWTLPQALPGLAQSTEEDIRSLQEQISLLNRELQEVRAQNAQLRTRLDAESQDRRHLRGELEENRFSLQQLQQRFDRLIGDLDARLLEIEDNITAVGTATTETPQDPAGGETTDPLSHEATTREDGILGQMTQDAEGNVLTATRQPEPSFEDRYNAAITLIQNTRYTEARATLKALNQEDDSHPLSSNILYWLGETYFVETRYKNAMSHFAKSALNHPDGAKYYDSLLKIALSLGNLGRLEQACQTLRDIGIPKDDRSPAPVEILVAQKKALKNFACTQ